MVEKLLPCPFCGGEAAMMIKDEFRVLPDVSNVEIWDTEVLETVRRETPEPEPKPVRCDKTLNLLEGI